MAVITATSITIRWSVVWSVTSSYCCITSVYINICTSININSVIADPCFVANFIGSPPTNFIDVTIEVSQNHVYAVHEAYRFEIETEVKEGLKKFKGQKVIMGVRPENFIVSDNDKLFDTKIHFIEPQGSHIVLVIDLNGQQFKVVSTELFDLKVGQSIGVGVNQKSLFFNKESGKRIR